MRSIGRFPRQSIEKGAKLLAAGTRNPLVLRRHRLLEDLPGIELNGHAAHRRFRCETALHLRVEFDLNRHESPQDCLYYPPVGGFKANAQDRLIGATALVEGIELVTHDRMIKKSGLAPIIW